MFRVPADPANPSFDHAFTVHFGDWMISTPAERKEWTRRRKAAAQLTGANQRGRAAGVAVLFADAHLWLYLAGAAIVCAIIAVAAVVLTG